MSYAHRSTEATTTLETEAPTPALDAIIAATPPKKAFPDISREKLAGMEKITLPAGVIRRIHVSQDAIRHNDNHRSSTKKLRTVMVKEQDARGEWRGTLYAAIVVASGETLLGYDPDQGSRPSAVYMETNGEIEAYVSATTFEGYCCGSYH